MALSSVISVGIVSVSLLLLAVVAHWLSSVLSKSKAKSLSDLRIYMKKGSPEEASSVAEIELDSASSPLEEGVNEEVNGEEKNEE